MVKVLRKPNEKIDSLIKRFNQKLKDSKVIPEYVDRMNYLKPSEIKNQKKYASIKRYKLKQSNNE